MNTQRWKAYIGGFVTTTPYYSIGEFGSIEAAKEAIERRVVSMGLALTTRFYWDEHNAYRYGDGDARKWGYVERSS